MTSPPTHLFFPANGLWVCPPTGPARRSSPAWGRIALTAAVGVPLEAERDAPWGGERRTARGWSTGTLVIPTFRPIPTIGEDADVDGA
jgi:hypothetical protein